MRCFGAAIHLTKLKLRIALIRTTGSRPNVGFNRRLRAAALDFFSILTTSLSIWARNSRFWAKQIKQGKSAGALLAG
jgi:hypothetical protein